MKRTTIFIDEKLERQLKRKARAEGKSMAQCVREAVVAYVANPAEARPLPSWVGMFSGPPDNASERVDEIVAEAIRKKYPQHFPPE
jgi:hypothetical protein